MKLNLGSGGRPLDGYTGVDLDPRADIVSDIRELKWATDGSVEEIIAIHVIEHFYYWEVQPMLLEWRRVLQPGGKLILECPNLLAAATMFLAGREDQMTMWAFYGTPKLKNELHCHHWGYTPKSLSAELKLAGFRDIEVLPAKFKVALRDMRVQGVR